MSWALSSALFSEIKSYSYAAATNFKISVLIFEFLEVVPEDTGVDAFLVID